ncbi:sulfur carrier protein ThiS [Pelistega sp. NLN82]|uniref:Sulfur carrier protein ThiS n=1 Tax=Pelistega ratti TaxID=2652177 RepID=A0A6L9Y5Y2_9BURK|nr:sulfur carrier protein ThiS [Pelistega ratti]NEN75676.1 sulfur carrier protein ThiS [Pelistega ratti]
MIITVYINGQAKEITDQTSLATFIQQLQIASGEEDNPKSIATAVNEEFIPRTAREQYYLKEGDHIMTFSPITGG